jgi:hypothetical protein
MSTSNHVTGALGSSFHVRSSSPAPLRLVTRDRSAPLGRTLLRRSGI